LGVFGAAGMRISGAGVRVLGRSVHVRLRAFLGPPARGIAFRITHLHATTSMAGLRTPAITATGRNSAKKAGGVRQKREGRDQKQHPHGQRLLDVDQEAVGFGAGSVPHREIVMGMGEKNR